MQGKMMARQEPGDHRRSRMQEVGLAVTKPARDRRFTATQGTHRYRGGKPRVPWSVANECEPPQLCGFTVIMLEHRTQPIDRCDAFPAATSRMGKRERGCSDPWPFVTQIANEKRHREGKRAALSKLHPVRKLAGVDASGTAHFSS